MVIVDASVWIDFLNQKLTPQTRWLLSVSRATPVGLTTLTLAEILQGMRTEKRFSEASQLLQTLPIINPCDVTVSLKAAAYFRTLRSLGVTVRGTIDCLVAAFCIEKDHQLLHSDRDFVPFEKHLGLRVLHP